MQIKVNGKPHSLTGTHTVQGLVEQLGISASQVAIERNREIVPRSRWGEQNLSDADEIEIVRFIGGG